MPVLSITRIRLGSLHRLWSFVRLTGAIGAEAKQSKGYIAGHKVVEWGFVFWTLSLWEDYESVYRFVGTGAHVRAMKFLPKWSSEAKVTHVEQDTRTIPAFSVCLEHINREERYPFVQRPSADHSQKKPAHPSKWRKELSIDF